MKRCSKLNKAISMIVSFSIMMSAVFVFRFPFFGTAHAASSDAHTAHKVCEGADACPDCEHDEAQQWTEWTRTDALPDTAGYYYLSDNVELTGEWNVSADISLCLNGKTITQTSPNQRVINVANRHELTLCDCKGEGKITGGSVEKGAGIYNGGSFSMYGGIISDNYAEEEGGGIYNAYSGVGNWLAIFGGTISNNSAVNGGGIYSDNDLIVHSGKILNNTAEENGGGIYNNDDLDLYDVTVSGNSAKQGGGVYNKDDQFAIITLHGGNVTDNTSEGSRNNIYLAGTSLIIVGEDISEDAVFGITTETKPDDENCVEITDVSDEDFSSRFFSDDRRYKVEDKVSEQVHYLTLVKAPVSAHIHDVCAGVGICPDNEHTDEHLNVEWQPWEKTDSLPESGGYYYLTENVTLDGVWNINADITLCLNGKTITQCAEGERVIQISAENSLSLCDCEGAGSVVGENGAIDDHGTLKLYSGVLSGGFAENGGGVLVDDDAEMFMCGGRISDCAAKNGGGVYIAENGAFMMYGGTITGNRAEAGGGVFDNGSFTVLCGMVVENTSNALTNNVYLAKDKTITVGGALAEGSLFGVTTEEVPAEGAPVSVTGENTADFSRFFFSDSLKYDTVSARDNNKQTVVLALSAQPIVTHKHPVCGDSSCKEHTAPVWTEWTKKDALPTASGYYFLAENVRLTEEWQPIGNVYLCFNGKTITQTAPDKRAVVINSNSVLTLCDCGENGGIINSKAGGIRNDGVLEMFGGVISGCTAENGGGILNNDHFIMDGGSIINNEADNGGGIYNAEGANFEIRGGLIRGNRAELGGGVFQNGRMTINGSPVIKGNGSNVYLPENKQITLSDNLTSDAEVGVSTAATPTDKAPVQVTGSNNFDHSKKLFSDNANYRIRLGAGLALMLTTPASPDENDPGNTPGGSKPGDNDPGNTPGGSKPGDNDPGNTPGGNKPGDNNSGIGSDMYLDIKPGASSDVPASDRDTAEKYLKTLNGWKFGQYYAINLYKKTENGNEKLTYTDIPVTITVTIPEELREADREFSLMRIYNGVPKLLGDTDSSAETITVVTDRFETFALVYRDKSADIGDDNNNGNENNNGDNNNGNNGSNNGNGNTPNPDTGRESIPLAIPAFASAALMLAIPAKHRDGNVGL